MNFDYNADFIKITANIKRSINKKTQGNRNHIGSFSLEITEENLGTLSAFGISVRDWLNQLYPFIIIVTKYA